MMTIHLVLFLVDVVGKYCPPPGLFQTQSHETNPGEVFCNGEFGGARHNLDIVWERAFEQA